MDKALKQRLVGASVLVALAVVVLPMLLSGQQGSPQESRRIELPPKPPELSFETRRFPIGDQDGSQPSVVTPPPSQESPANTGPASEPPPQAITPAAHAEAGNEPDNEPADKAIDTAQPPVETIAESTGPAAGPTISGDAGAGRYLVQVASFSSAGNANRLAEKLRNQHLPVLMDTVDAAAGRLFRVRVGPYTSSDDADAAIRTVKTSMPDLDPRVLDLRPDESEPVATPSDPLVRWVVQLGSFAEQANATKLVYQLRDAGYRASSIAVTDPSGTAFKVRVGPMIERTEAVQMEQAIKRDLGLEGLVMSTD